VRRVFLAAAFLLSISIPAASYAASFDCKKATTEVEKMICADTVLSKLDEELSAAYNSSRQGMKQDGGIKLSQKKWLKKRNDCKNAICLKKHYEARLSVLRSNVPGEGKSIFSGQWRLKICDKSTDEECGEFIVYLVQTGKTICGDHFFSAPGGGRFNEGAPRSIIGSLVEKNVGEIVITSGRNGAVFKGQILLNGDTLKWQIIQEIKQGSEGDSALVLDKGDLLRESPDKNYQAALSACEGF
jgi:uncharacterized protein